MVEVTKTFLQCVHIKTIVHANNWSLTLAFHIIFAWAPVNFTWTQARVRPGEAMPLRMKVGKITISMVLL